MFICTICEKPVEDKSIFCDFCESWIHFENCSNLSQFEFDTLSRAETESWACSKCLNCTLPFSDSDSAKPKSGSGSTRHPNNNANANCDDYTKVVISDLNKVIQLQKLDDNVDSLDFNSNSCKYYENGDFRKLNLDPKSFSVFHLNIASMNSHFGDLNTLLASLQFEFSVVGISESRFVKGVVPTLDHRIEGYSCFNTPTEASAGGTLLYISKRHVSHERKDLDSLMYQAKCLESTFAEIVLPKKTNIIVGTIYRHPNGMSIDTFNSEFLIPFLHKVGLEKKQVILLGDFNIDLLKTDDVPRVSEFLDIMGSNLVIPQILLPTRITPRSKTLIDNIFSTITGQTTISGNLVHKISDHLPQFSIFSTEIPSNLGEHDRQYLNWSKFDQENFILDYLDIDWELEFRRSGPIDPNTCFDIFNSKIQNLISKHVPTGRLTNRQIKTKQKPWITSAIVKSISKRDHYFHKFIKAKNPHAKSEFHEIFKRYRNMIVTLCRQSKVNYYKRFFNQYSNNMRKTWDGIRSIVCTKPFRCPTPSSIRIGDTLITDPLDIANNFNNFFTSIADSIRDSIPPTSKRYSNYLKNSNRNSIFLSPVVKEEVVKIIESLSLGKSSGPNSVPVRILKMLKNDIATPMSFLINLSFESGIFPQTLKSAKVVPVFKNKGSKLNVSNYRPISLLSNIEKIYEKIMYNRTVDFLHQHEIFYAKQFGFRKHYSTVHTLLNITERIRKCLDNGELACGVFIDLQKAFDTVDHKILLSKLNHYGIRGMANNWFKSYLSNRSQFVSIGSSNSSSKSICHGVPQGSVLGPLLFLIYINDLHNCIRSCETYHFADDTHLLKFSDSLDTLCKKVNLDLKNITCWLRANKISLNAGKTEFVIFKSKRRSLDYIPFLKISGNRVYPSESVKYLGVYLDEHLNWKPHVDYIASKLQRANGVLSKIRYYVPTKTLVNVYHAIFNSHLHYGCQIWGLRDNTVTRRILTLQKAALRLITFNQPRAPSSPIFSNLGILKVFDLVKTLNVQFLHKFLNSDLPQDTLNTFVFSKINHPHSTRSISLGLLVEPYCNSTTYGSYSFTKLAVTEWNKIQRLCYNSDLANLNLQKVKTLATKFYLDTYLD